MSTIFGTRFFLLIVGSSVSLMGLFVAMMRWQPCHVVSIWCPMPAASYKACQCAASHRKTGLETGWSDHFEKNSFAHFKSIEIFLKFVFVELEFEARWKHIEWPRASRFGWVSVDFRPNLAAFGKVWLRSKLKFRPTSHYLTLGLQTQKTLKCVSMNLESIYKINDPNVKFMVRIRRRVVVCV